MDPEQVVDRVVVNKPDILVGDEPCANLDSENSTMVLDLFKEFNEEMQQTIVMVSHEDWHKNIFTGSYGSGMEGSRATGRTGHVTDEAREKYQRTNLLQPRFLPYFSCIPVN